MIFYILIIIFKQGACYVSADQMAQIFTETIFWDDPNYFFGSNSVYCPFSFVPHIGNVQRNETNSYLLFMARDLLTTEILFIHYVSIYENNQTIIHTVKIKTYSGIYEAEFIFDKLEYEGVWMSQYMYFEQENQILRIGFLWKQQKQEQEFQSDIFPPNDFQFTMGGSLKVKNIFNVFKYFDHGFNQQFFLSSFPGKLAANIGSGQQELQYQLGYSDECVPLTQSPQLLHYSQFSALNKVLLIPDSEYGQYYSFYFWVKIDITQGQIAHIIRATINKQSDFINQIASDSFDLKYFYQDNQWLLQLECYSYIFPFIFTKNQFTDLEKRMKRDSIDKSFIEQWHTIQVTYKDYSLFFLAENYIINQRISYNFENVYQYSYAIFRFFLGGNQYEESSLNGEIAQFTYFNCYDETRVISQCHFSCLTCYGPFSNQCTSCPTDANRVFDSKAQTCNCELWFLEKEVIQCYGQNNQDIIETELYLTLDPRYDQLEPEIICAYGYFKFDNECYLWYYLRQISPAASQEGSIFCLDCLVNPNTWFFKPICYDQWQPYDNNLNNVYYLQVTQSSENIILFLFVNEELIPCMDCILCDPSKSSFCFLYPYQHGNSDIFIDCYNAHSDFVNGQCIGPEYHIKLRPTCDTNCGFCFFRKCRACIDQIKYFMSYNGVCLECRIPNCKYCFQYNQYDLNQVTPLINLNYDFSTEPEDYIIACAKCFEGYIFNLATNQCVFKSPDLPCLNGYFDDKYKWVCTTTALSTFDSGVAEISNCEIYISFCIRCVQDSLGTIQCVECSVGYILDIDSATCLSCRERYPKYPELVVDCWEQSSDLDSWKFEVQSFFYNFMPNKTPLVISGFYWIRRYGVNQCIDGYMAVKQASTFVDYCVPQCGDKCSTCIQKGLDVTCKQCSYQFEEYNILSYFDNQCQACPYPCRLCQARSNEEIFAFNPYFIINQETISQTYRCLLNFDNKNTFIEQKSGQVRGKNSQLNNKFMVQIEPRSFDQSRLLQHIGNDYLIRRKVSTYVQKVDISTLFDNNLRESIFSIENTTFIVNGQPLSDSYELWNQTSVILQNFLISYNNQYTLVSSLYGVQVRVVNFTANNIKSEKGLIFLNFPNNVTISNLSLINSNFSSNSLIKITEIISTYFVDIVIQEIYIDKCNFFNSSVIRFYQNSVITINKLIVENMIISNTIFERSGFLIEDLQISITNITIINLNMINCSMNNSKFFNIPSTDIAKINKVNLQNVVIINSTLLQLKNSFTIRNIHLDKLQLIYSYILTSLNYVNLPNYFYVMSNFSISNTVYSGYSPFYIQQNSYSAFKSFAVQKIALSKNRYDNAMAAKQHYEKESSVDSLCFFSIFGDHIDIADFNSNQQFGFHNLCLFSFTSISIVNCVQSQSGSGTLSNQQFLEIQKFQSIFLKNITIVNQQIVNNPIIKISSQAQRMNSQNIIIDSLIFSNNYLVKTQSYTISTLLYISSDSQCETSIKDSSFQNNTIQHLLEDFSTNSPGLIFIQLYQSQISIQACIFSHNIIKNTSNSLTYLQSDRILLQNITATFSNYNESLSQNDNQNSSMSIKSVGGFGFYIASNLRIENSLFQNSISHQGGCFYIKLKDTGSVILTNIIIFNSTSWSQLNDNSYGGSLVIDAQSSSLLIKFYNLQIVNSISRDLGGFLYLIPSQLSNIISIMDVSIINSIAQDYSIFAALFPISSLINQVILHNITIFIDKFAYLKMKENLEFDQIIDSKSVLGMLVILNSQIKISLFSLTGVSCQTTMNLQYSNFLEIQYTTFQDIELIGEYIMVVNNYQQNNLAKDSQNLVLFSNLLLQNIQTDSFHSLISILMIQNIKQTIFFLNLAKILLYNIQFINNICTQCTGSIFAFKQQNQINSIQFSNILFFNNTCGQASCFYLQQDTEKESLKASIQQSKFIKNKAKFGGAIFLQYRNLEISHTLFLGNSAEENGGAAYFILQMKDLKLLQYVQFINNVANVGGAIYQEFSIVNPIFFTKSLFFGNVAKQSVNNIREQPSQLQISLFGNEFKSILLNGTSTAIPSFQGHSSYQRFIILPSGQKIGSYKIWDKFRLISREYNINLELLPLNNLGERQVDLIDSICILKSYIVLNNDQENLSVEQLKFNIIKELFELAEVIFTFDPYSSPDQYLTVSAECDFIYDPTYNLQFLIKTFSCQEGEFYSQSNCFICDSGKGFYSLKPKSLECNKIDPKIIKSNTANQIELFSGYWRPSTQNNLITRCTKNTMACEGGWSVGDASCAHGYIGALCEECDSYNVMGKGSFYKNTKFQCIGCGQVTQKIFTSFIIIALTLISIFLTVQSAYTIYLSFKGLKLRTKHYDIVFRKNLDQSAALIKMIVNYFQILMSIKSFQLDMYIEFLDFISPIGNPVGGATYSFDCFFSQQSDISIIYINLLQSLIIPLIYYLIYLLIYLSLVYYKKVPLASTIYITALLYIFFYTQPNIVQELSALIANRQISSIYWINKNVSYLYYTATHIKWVLFGIFPLFVIIGFVIPFFLLYNLFRRRHSFNSERVRQIWGYIYNDYQKESYFWEILRIIQREIIILSLALNEERIIMKGIIIFLVLLVYYITQHGSGILKPLQYQLICFSCDFLLLKEAHKLHYGIVLSIDRTMVIVIWMHQANNAKGISGINQQENETLVHINPIKINQIHQVCSFCQRNMFEDSVLFSLLIYLIFNTLFKGIYNQLAITLGLYFQIIIQQMTFAII